MAVISRKYEYVFFATPQTGSKAIAKTLIERVDGHNVPEKPIKQDGKVIAKPHHTTYAMLIKANLLSKKELEDMLKVAGIRNPFDLLVSRYLKHKGRFVQDKDKYSWAHKNDSVKKSMDLAQNNDFKGWLFAKHQEQIAADKPLKGQLIFTNKADLVIRFEQLQEGYDEFMRRIRFEGNKKLIEYNATAERSSGGEKISYKTFYDDECIELVNKLYEPVLKEFGYSF